MDLIRNLHQLFQQWCDDEGSGRHSDAAKLGDVQIECRRGRLTTTSLTYDHFRQTTYLPILDFDLVGFKKRAASFCVQMCKLLPHCLTEKDERQRGFDDLVYLYESLLSDVDFSASSKFGKTCGASPEH